MNYYEELGLRQSASNEEIRQAYKTAARLLHPDCQADPRMRALAECQLKRLNEIFAVLLRPQKRAEYDVSLEPIKNPPFWDGTSMPVPARSSSAFALRNWPWIFLGSVLFAVTGWSLLERSAGVRDALPAAPLHPVAQASTPEHKIAVSVSPQPFKPTVKRQVMRETSVSDRKPETSPTVDAPLPKPEAKSSAPSKAESLPAEIAPALPASPHAETGFTGTWLYSPQLKDGDDSLAPYPALFVEFLLTEESGNLKGTYRARHRIPDRTVSPEVLFRVFGKQPFGNSGKLEWRSNDGGRGEMAVTLRERDILTVTWWTTEFGIGTGLSSGTATLVREHKRE